MNPPEKVDIRSTDGASVIYRDVISLNSPQEEIRVLHLESGSGSSLLKCTLHRVSLQSVQAPSYEALSYTWGNENDRRAVVVNGYLVDVTFNLYSALCRLRREDGTRVLWIDALCINQTDLDERAQQVRLMRNIYTMCDQTVIWIGEPLEDLLPTWEILNEDDSTSIDQIFHAFANLRLLSSGHLSEQPLFIDMTGEEFSYYIPWWTRVWTVQEIILPPKATFIYGPISVDMSCLLEAFANLSRHMFEPCCSEVFSRCNFRVRKCFRKLGSVLTNIKNMRTSHDNGTNVDLWEALTTFRARHATDHRDKVHGILGLVNSWLGQPIVPNYRTTTEAIYCQAAIFTATGSQSLLPLHFPLQKHACPNLPSWCVDWTAASGLADQLNVYQWSQQPFKAFSIQQADRCHIVPHADNRILEVRGRRCDRVASVGKICQGDEPNEKRKAYCDWFLLAELHRDPSRMYRSGCSYFEAFWKCLCWDMILHMSETAGWINGLTLNTTFFVTDSGYLGLGPPGTNVGDEVWCLFGGHMPFILRPVATTREAVLGPGQKRLHQVLGICYVHGIMNGEVTNDESIPEEVLYLA
ncbi:uncharacterized protein TRIVIDRAFT_143449 [Trichoderma virens Gv29-8]|uniref:Heterokaryon incompatibility domain-containing protein n=1 Tax=Hypocrea virens (strain Gv29-8 / FGSC 10586) TaxID=413071 RepID=G9MK89_HYPVG|nr:uncharacterized protein TRIVIDRAFT_143449 [Trichoderma virens Gv29-8]EHK25083.1 hypothetical protein TRIVIDRAFT_143449 [Trichoderma virens Gv29-8]